MSPDGPAAPDGPPAADGPARGVGAEQLAWRRRRDEAAAARAEVEARARDRDSARARALLDAFLVEVRRRGIPPVPLRARAGGASYRTGLTGWVLREDGSVAVDEEGGFYVLVVAPSTRARLLGVVLRPSDPPLQLGRGGRDGESADLADVLARYLA